MIAAALLVVAVALVVCVLVFAGVVRSVLRASARREDLLVNQMMHLAGRPWQAAPAEPPPRTPPPPREYRPDPAQLPDGWEPTVIAGGEG